MRVQCGIAGGGPAGMMLGYLLARAGIETAVLEKHADFLRDFRGDTVHPSTLEVMYELGLLESFLQRPHQEIRELAAEIGDTTVTIGDFSHLPTHCKFLALMPQWEFLNFLATEARRLPGFHLLMQTEAVAPLVEDGRIAGVDANGPDGPLQIRAPLIVACDGRHSTMRERAGLSSTNFGSPMDVLWMRLAKRAGDPLRTFGRIRAGQIFITLDRGDYWQCALVIPKGGIDRVRARGLPALRATIAEVAPFLADRVDALASWEDIKLLTVVVDRLPRWWRPGFLCIGDAAHAMSPIGGVGINLAIQDAVAAANLLTAPLAAGAVTDDDLRRVQRRREWPTRATQRVQIFAQDHVIGRVLGNSPRALPWPIKLLRRFPVLRRLPARLVGVGVRPERVKSIHHQGHEGH
jgi:2-polyprenyl-6-methoxyphenol hydroxylase-like FAD-dependent oxidoreductase